MQMHCTSALFEARTIDISVNAVFVFRVLFFNLSHLHTSLFFVLNDTVLSGERSDEV
jgi:hypothetical protein